MTRSTSFVEESVVGGGGGEDRKVMESGRCGMSLRKSLLRAVMLETTRERLLGFPKGSASPD